MVEFQAVGDGADRTPTSARNLADRQALAAVEAENGQERRRIEVHD